MLFVEGEGSFEFFYFFIELVVFESFVFDLLKEMVSLSYFPFNEFMFLFVVGLKLVFFVFEGLDLSLEPFIHGFKGLVFPLQEGVGFE